MEKKTKESSQKANEKARREIEELIEDILDSPPEVTSIENEVEMDKDPKEEAPEVILPEYKLQESYTKEEIMEEKGEEPEEEQEDRPHEITLEWEQGLKDEDAIYKDPIERIQEFLEDLDKPGKRFLDRRTQKYDPG